MTTGSTYTVPKEVESLLCGYGIYNEFRNANNIKEIETLITNHQKFHTESRRTIRRGLLCLYYQLRDDSLLQKRSILQKHSIQFGRGIEETHIQTQSHQVYRQWIVLDYRWRITELLFYVITHFF